MGHKHKKKNKDSEFIELADVVNYNTLLRAEEYVENGKRAKLETAQFHIKKFTNVLDILRHIEEKTYDIDQLYTFTIYEPKKRAITANKFDDKIVQRVMCNAVLEPAIQPKLIYDNYATQTNKGTRLALDRLRHHMISFAATTNNWGTDGWIFDADIHKFFYEIDRNTCFDMIRQLPIDHDCEDIIHKQVYAIEDFDGSEIGLCIGFQSSQWLAVLYLNPLDHFIKEHLHIKYYGRYVDNFYILHNDLEYLKYCVTEISNFLDKYLHLSLNPKSNIHPFSQGEVFLGFHFTYSGVTHDVDVAILNKSIKRMKKRVNKHIRLIYLGKMTTEKALESLESWRAHAEYGFTHKAENAYIKCKKLILKTGDLYSYQYKEFDHDSRGFIILDRIADDYDSDGFFVLHKNTPDRFKKSYGKYGTTTYNITNTMKRMNLLW